MTIPPALAPLAQYRQFITYIVRPGKDGKLDKLPCDWRTGAVANAHDPAIWTDYTTAYLAGGGMVGFVFTDNDPFWFLDIDNCLTPSGWSPLAQELCSAFAGAAMEVSVSGKGLHIFGVGKMPAHATRNKSLGLELYHTERFVALGTMQQGNAMTDCTAAMVAVVAKYFPRIADAQVPTDWTSAPVAEWSGSTDDDDLIRRACNSKSAAGVFGAKATFQQLWDADEAALTRAYPEESGRGYGASEADAALAQHLAFWTGKDCARIERLMRRSKLARDKWNEHSSYMRLTITGACGRQRDVCKDKAVAPAPSTTHAIRDVTEETWLQPEQMKIMFAGCTYVRNNHEILMPGGDMLNEARFNAALGGYTYTLDRTAGKPAKHAWDAFLNSRDVRFPKVIATEFAPTKAPGAIWERGNSSYVNSYWPIRTPARQGNPRPFLDHLAKLLPEQRDQDILLAYMAAVVQYPGVKFQWAPLLQGVEGNGKTLFSRCLIEAIGREHCHTPKASQLASKFNDWLDGRIFIAVEDIYVDPEEGLDVMGALLPMITNDWIEIEAKGGKKSSKTVCANWMLNSNHRDAIKITKTSRRFAAFYTAQQRDGDLKRDGMDGSYFPDLYAWLKREGYAIVNGFLKDYSIPAELNPAGECHRAPRTSSTDDAVAASVGNIEQEIIHAIEQEHVGFRGGWVSSHFLDKLIVEKRSETKYPRNKRTDLMLELGYMVHPGLAKGQVNNPVTPDGTKSRLFIMIAGHPAETLRGVDAAKAYSEAQAAGGQKLLRVA